MINSIEISLSEEQEKKWSDAAKENSLTLENWIYEACNKHLNATKLVVHEARQRTPEWTYGLSTRALMCLLSAGFKSKENVLLELAKKKDRTFLKIPNLGEGTLKEIKNWAYSTSLDLDLSPSKTMIYKGVSHD